MDGNGIYISMFYGWCSYISIEGDAVQVYRKLRFSACEYHSLSSISY